MQPPRTSGHGSQCPVNDGVEQPAAVTSAIAPIKRHHGESVCKPAPDFDWHPAPAPPSGWTSASLTQPSPAGTEAIARRKRHAGVHRVKAAQKGLRIPALAARAAGGRASPQ